MTETGWSAFVTCHSAVPPAPGGLTAKATDATTIDLQWVDHAGNESGYEVYRSDGSADSYRRVAQLAASAVVYQDRGLTGNTRYWYKVRAVNGAESSALSNEADATTLPLPPGAPTELTATAASESRTDLQWQGTDATPFRVFRSGGNGEGFVEIGQTPAGVYTYGDINLAPAAAYTYRVLAENAGGLSLPSNEATAVTLQAWPAAPAALTLVAVTSGSVALTWKDMATNETGYLLERSEGTDGNFVQVAELGEGTESFSNTGLAPATGYSYRVCAFNDRGKSPYSEVVRALTTAVPPIPAPPHRSRLPHRSFRPHRTPPNRPFPGPGSRKT